jgi:FO synthase
MESITRAAGAIHGQEMAPEAMEELILSIKRRPKQCTTVYGEVAEDRQSTSFCAEPLSKLPRYFTPVDDSLSAA